MYFDIFILFCSIVAAALKLIVWKNVTIKSATFFFRQVSVDPFVYFVLSIVIIVRQGHYCQLHFCQLSGEKQDHDVNIISMSLSLHNLLKDNPSK